MAEPSDAPRAEAPAPGPASAWLTAVGRDGRGPIAVLDLPRLVAAARERSLSP